jgi:hypothetical protein
LDKEAYIYDIDGTLLNMDVKAWIIDKDNPSKPILRLDPLELFMIEKGVFKKDDLIINYDDNRYYISKELFKKIQKKKRITIENLGVSFIEYIDDRIYNKAKVIYLMDNIRHLADITDKIILLTGRHNRKLSTKIINKLRLKLKDLGIEIWKMHFVGNHLRTNSDIVSNEKVKVLLEYLIGLKIKNDEFIPIRQDQFDFIHYYDDDFKNIDYIEDMQVYFEQVLRNTKDDEVYKYISKRLEMLNPKIELNLITSNVLNKFKTTSTSISMPKKYPIRISESRRISKFNEFKSSV